MPADDPDSGRSEDRAAALTAAIRAGDVAAVRQLLTNQPSLANTPIGGASGRTPLHVATDWPGYFPAAPEVVAALIAAGADPNARTGSGPGAETPLHWAASSDDADVAEVLIDGGADIEAPDGSIGTPLDNAIGYGCWHVARLLVARGAKVDALWHAAALGALPRLEQLLVADPPPDPEQLNEAFWQACHGGQRRAAELLLARGADINAVPGYNSSPAVDVAAGPDTRRDLLVSWLREHGARQPENR